MATGVVSKYWRAGEATKQVLVVVTAGWSVLCFDHNLKKQWEAAVKVYHASTLNVHLTSNQEMFLEMLLL